MISSSTWTAADMWDNAYVQKSRATGTNGKTRETQKQEFAETSLAQSYPGRGDPGLSQLQRFPREDKDRG